MDEDKLPDIPGDDLSLPNITLDNLRKSPPVESSLPQRSLSQALCMCLSLFRKHQQVEAMTQNQPLSLKVR